MAALAWAVAGLVVGGAVVFAVMRVRAAHALASALSQHANGLRARMEAIDARHQHDAASAEENALTLVTRPYQDRSGAKGLWHDDRRAETGYLLQLFVNGVPCLAPHRVPLQFLVKGDVTSARLEAASKSALELTQAMAAFHPHIRALRELPESK